MQTVINSESGRELVAQQNADLRELYAQVTDSVFQALRDHDFCFLGGTSGLGKSELFLEQTFGFDKLGTRFGSIISKLDVANVSSFIIEEVCG